VFIRVSERANALSFETYFELIRGAPTTFSHGHRD
jgi:hypothetical protein